MSTKKETNQTNTKLSENKTKKSADLLPVMKFPKRIQSSLGRSIYLSGQWSGIAITLQMPTVQWHWQSVRLLVGPQGMSIPRGVLCCCPLVVSPSREPTLVGCLPSCAQSFRVKLFKLPHPFGGSIITFLLIYSCIEWRQTGLKRIEFPKSEDLGSSLNHDKYPIWDYVPWIKVQWHYLYLFYFNNLIIN